jgi:hypothetical protein
MSIIGSGRWKSIRAIYAQFVNTNGRVRGYWAGFLGYVCVDRALRFARSCGGEKESVR